MSTTERSETTRTVVRALVVNLRIVVLKAAAGLLTRSPAMIIEAVHSLLDSTTEGFLLVGQWHGRRWAKGVYLWGTVAAASMFILGGLYGVYEGVTTIFGGAATSWPLVAVAVLALSAILETPSWRTAYAELDADRDGQPWIPYLRRTKLVAAKAVLVEDSSDISGDLLGIVGIVVGMVTGSPVWVGLATGLIGLLLTGLAFELGWSNVKLLFAATEIVPEPELVAA